MAEVEAVDWVVDGVYIGNALAAGRAEELRAAGITHVLKLHFGTSVWPEDFVVCDMSIADGEFVPLATLQQGVAFIHDQVKAGQPVLVACAAGISRSATFVLAYLLEQGYTLADAWALLRERHPQAMPAWELWRSLLTHYQLPQTWLDTLREAEDYIL